MRMDLQLKGEAPEGWQRWNFLPILLVLVFLSVYLQIQNGVYSSDFGADPDEPAHVVTSLMMRDYLATGIWRGELPMAFAQIHCLV